MWADGSEEDGGDVWVNEGTACGEGVCGGASGSGEDAAVGLDDGQEFIVTIEFEVGDVRGWPTVDDELCRNIRFNTCTGFWRSGVYKPFRTSNCSASSICPLLSR